MVPQEHDSHLRSYSDGSIWPCRSSSSGSRLKSSSSRECGVGTCDTEAIRANFMMREDNSPQSEVIGAICVDYSLSVWAWWAPGCSSKHSNTLGSLEGIAATEAQHIWQRQKHSTSGGGRSTARLPDAQHVWQTQGGGRTRGGHFVAAGRPRKRGTVLEPESLPFLAVSPRGGRSGRCCDLRACTRVDDGCQPAMRLL